MTVSRLKKYSTNFKVRFDWCWEIQILINRKISSVISALPCREQIVVEPRLRLNDLGLYSERRRLQCSVTCIRAWDQTEELFRNSISTTKHILNDVLSIQTSRKIPCGATADQCVEASAGTKIRIYSVVPLRGSETCWWVDSETRSLCARVVWQVLGYKNTSY